MRMASRRKYALRSERLMQFSMLERKPYAESKARSQKEDETREV